MSKVGDNALDGETGYIGEFVVVRCACRLFIVLPLFNARIRRRDIVFSVSLFQHQEKDLVTNTYNRDVCSTVVVILLLCVESFHIFLIIFNVIALRHYI